MTAALARPTVVFDLDGTLVDTAHDLIGTLNAVMAREGLPALPVAEVGHLVGQGARSLVDRGLRANAVVPDAAMLDRLFVDFIAHYAENIAEASRPYPGVEASLDRFAAEGFILAVCTNKPEALSVKLLDALGLTGRFAAICGGDTFPVRKPDPAHITGTIDRAGGDRRRAVMVGDSINDIAAAKNAAIPAVAVTFGYSDRPVAELGADVVVDRFDAVYEAVARLAGA